MPGPERAAFLRDRKGCIVGRKLADRVIDRDSIDVRCAQRHPFIH